MQLYGNISSRHASVWLITMIKNYHVISRHDPCKSFLSQYAMQSHTELIKKCHATQRHHICHVNAWQYFIKMCN